VLGDRSSELAGLFDEDDELPRSANRAIGRALSKVDSSNARPLVAATILHEAAAKLNEPQKAQLMYRFIDANLHPDFRTKNAVSDKQRLNTATAVDALFSQLDWGSSEVERAVEAHAAARVAGENPPAPRPRALAAGPSETTALAVRPAQAIGLPSNGRKIARGYKIGAMASLAAAIMSGLGGSPLGLMLAIPFLISLLAAFVYTSRPAAAGVEADPNVLEAMKELDAEFPTLSEAELDRRIALLEERSASSKGGSE
jgi:hypothetical protein